MATRKKSTAPAPNPQSDASATLARVLGSQTFRQVERLKRFLDFIGRETIEGRGDRLKEYVIGVQVFDKEQLFDPRADPIVRVQARRLRARLERYYLEEGHNDEQIIDLPKGRYTPAFRPRTASPAATPGSISATAAAHNTVAVGRFADLAPHHEAQHAAAGLRAEVVHQLTGCKGLRVLGWADDATPPGATYVVTGTTRRAGDVIRLTAHVVSGATGAYLASDSVDASEGTLFQAQESIARFVVSVVRPQVGNKTSWRGARSSENLAARNLYLQGRYHLAQRTEESLGRAVEFFQSALTEDQDYALAHSGLSDAYGLLTNYGVRGPADVWTKAASHAASGVMLDPSAVETRTTLAHVKAVQDWDWLGAEREFRAALDISSDYATAHHWYAMSCLMPMGRLDDALREMLVAQSLDPVSAIIARDIAVLHLYRRELDAALEHCDHTIELNPHFAPAYLTLGLVQEQRRDLDETLAAVHRAIDLAPNSPRMQAALARTLALSGKKDQAQQILGTLESLMRERYVSPFDFACVRFALGQRDLGFKWLQRASRDRAFEMNALMFDPRFDAVRADARFKTILKQIGLQ